MKLMEIKVVKTVRNHVNRTTNCETANLNKTVSAAAAQVQDIRLFGIPSGFPGWTRICGKLAQLRLDNEALSLRELAEMLTIRFQEVGSITVCGVSVKRHRRFGNAVFRCG